MKILSLFHFFGALSYAYIAHHFSIFFLQAELDRPLSAEEAHHNSHRQLQDFLVEFLSTRGELLDKDRPDLPYRRACRAARVHLDSLLARVHEVAAATAAGVAPPPARPHPSGGSGGGAGSGGGGGGSSWAWDDAHLGSSGLGGSGGGFGRSISAGGGGYGGGSSHYGYGRSGLGGGRSSSSSHGRQRSTSTGDRPKLTSPQVTVYLSKAMCFCSVLFMMSKYSPV